MPKLSRRGMVKKLDSLTSIIEKYDLFLLDAYGVLNVGNKPIMGASELLVKIKSQNKKFIILTNGATYPTFKKFRKFRNWNFPIQDHEVISSRDVVKDFLELNKDKNFWGVIGNEDSDIDELCIKGQIISYSSKFDDFDGFIFLGSEKWDDKMQVKLINSLKKKKRQILVANSDLVAPLSNIFSLEPGYWSWNIQKEVNVDLLFFGKPYKSIFNLALKEFYKKNKKINLNKILMVGDSLHTDILGALSFGVDTALISSYGLFANVEVENFLESTKIYPDFLVSRL